MKRIRSSRIHNAHVKASSTQGTHLVEAGQTSRAVAHVPQYSQALVPTPSQGVPFDEHAFLAALVDTSDALMLVLDHTGRVVLFNHACEKLSGYNAQDMIGTYPWKDLLLPDAHLEADAIFAHQWLDRIALTGEQIWRSQCGREWHIYWSVKLLRNVDGLITHMLCTGMNITDLIQAQVNDHTAPTPPSTHAPDDRFALAREIHDGPLHDVHQIHHQLARLRSADSPHDHAALAAAQQSTHTAIHALRQLCTDLRPPTLALLGLTPAIRAHARELHHAYPHVQIQLLLHDDGTVLTESIRLHLYRIYQAALSNVLRHAQAGYVTVAFTWDAEQVCLTVSDDGHGFHLPAAWQAWAQAGRRYGLLGMHERAQLCGGSCHIRSTPGGGTTVQVCVPGVVALPSRQI